MKQPLTPRTPASKSGGTPFHGSSDIPVDPNGQWAHPGQKVIVPSGKITMEGVGYPVFGVDNLGVGHVMLPGMEYDFAGDQVLEVPLGGAAAGDASYQSGGSVEKEIQYYAGKGFSREPKIQTSGNERFVVMRSPQGPDYDVSVVIPDEQPQRRKEPAVNPLSMRNPGFDVDRSMPSSNSNYDMPQFTNQRFDDPVYDTNGAYMGAYNRNNDDPGFLPAASDMSDEAIGEQLRARGLPANTQVYQQGGTYPQYRQDTTDLIAQHRLRGAAAPSAMPLMQPQRGAQYGSGSMDMADFAARTGISINTADPNAVRSFQEQYNNRYKAATGKDYFDGQGSRAADGKFGQYTWGAPALPGTAGTTPQPSASATARRVRWEKLNTPANGQSQYSPIFEGNWSRRDTEQFFRTLPDKATDGTAYLKGDPYYEMFAGKSGAATQNWNARVGQDGHNVPMEQLGKRPLRGAVAGTYHMGGESLAAGFDPGGIATTIQMPGQEEEFYQQTAGVQTPWMNQPIMLNQPAMGMGTPLSDQYGIAPGGATTLQPRPQGQPEHGSFNYGAAARFVGAGMDVISGMRERGQARRDDLNNSVQDGLSDNLYGSTPVNNPYGNYSTNVGMGRSLRPRTYDVGGEYDIDDTEIARLKAQGYQIEIA